MIVTPMQSAPARMNLRLSKRRLPFITVGDVTKNTAVTVSVTAFSLRIKEIRSVTALTPIFCIN